MNEFLDNTDARDIEFKREVLFRKIVRAITERGLSYSSEIRDMRAQVRLLLGQEEETNPPQPPDDMNDAILLNLRLSSENKQRLIELFLAYIGVCDDNISYLFSDEDAEKLRLLGRLSGAEPSDESDSLIPFMIGEICCSGGWFSLKHFEKVHDGMNEIRINNGLKYHGLRESKKYASLKTIDEIPFWALPSSVKEILPDTIMDALWINKEENIFLFGKEGAERIEKAKDEMKERINSSFNGIIKKCDTRRNCPEIPEESAKGLGRILLYHFLRLAGLIKGG